MIFTYSFQDKNLKRSVTSPGSVSDWLSSHPAAAGAAEKGNVQLEHPCPRQRTWSARTFHDLLAPIPQLQKKWCSWSTNSPFTKLVDSSVSPAGRGGCWGLSSSISPLFTDLNTFSPWPVPHLSVLQCKRISVHLPRCMAKSLPNYIVI